MRFVSLCLIKAINPIFVCAKVKNIKLKVEINSVYSLVTGNINSEK